MQQPTGNSQRSLPQLHTGPSPCHSPLQCKTSSRPRMVATPIRTTHACAGRNMLRSGASYLRVSEMIVGTLLIGLLFWQLGDTQAASSDRIGAMYALLSFYLMLTEARQVDLFVSERAVIDREAGMFHLSAYFMAKSVVEMLLDPVFVLLSFFVASAMVDFTQGDTGDIGLLAAVMFAAVWACGGLGVLIACAAPPIACKGRSVLIPRGREHCIVVESVGYLSEVVGFDG
eukprot:TRINITY_DN1919_c0_g5_i2.p1 TRINITY_DN1919_c0_g5~~TRINITY_DN1919_c0_g5_i2.p1  ORF type:complete len:230 (-),score=39.66 TRINITY_DN1919_c0_g5_i2:99-788(-)